MIYIPIVLLVNPDIFVVESGFNPDDIAVTYHFIPTILTNDNDQLPLLVPPGFVFIDNHNSSRYADKSPNVPKNHQKLGTNLR